MVEVDELAVIFEPFINNDGVLNFIPIEVIEGYFDEESERFIDKNLYSYSHLTYGEASRGYALRLPICDLSVEYPDKSLEEIKLEILDKNSNYIYFLGDLEDIEENLIFRKNEETGETTMLIDEDTNERLMYLFDDEELNKLMLNSSLGNETKEQIENNTEPEEKNIKTNINPHELYKQIKETVRGQDDAIKEIVTCVWKNHNSESAKNMIIVGPSGSGKTEILRQLSKKMNVPLMITTVTGMSQAGYIGAGTDEILSNLLTFTKGDVAKAEKAIVVLDEIDKIAYNGYESGKVSTDGVQNELLKIIEDGTFFVNYNTGFSEQKVALNTSNITFIGVGAFNGMFTVKKEKGIGFGQDITEKEIKKEKVSPEDLIKFGLKPELVGRMGKIVRLNELDLEAMKDIIKNSEKSAYKSEIKFINKKGIKIAPEIEEEIIEEIAKIAISKKIGARSIEGIVTEMFSDIEFDISDPDENYTELQISKETVTNPKKYTLKK